MHSSAPVSVLLYLRSLENNRYYINIHAGNVVRIRHYFGVKLSSPLDNCDRILENLPFGHKQIFAKTRLKIYTMVLKLISFSTFG